MTEEVKRTPFYAQHQALGAKLVPFAGFWMPIQYKGIIEEHRQVRNAVGVFDVSHMGEFIIRGPRAAEFVNYLTINDVSKLAVGQVQYSAMCYPDGGIVDDLLVYRFPEHFMLVVNAANITKDFAWAKQHLMEGVELIDQSDETALLAIQGPLVFETLQSLTAIDLKSIPFYHFQEGKIAGIDAIISRTGYTGEKGFEIYHCPQQSSQLWEAIFDAGKPYGIAPVGLGARDTLRLEMKYCLYGNDIDQTTNPLEAGLGWITKLDKPAFIGREALLKIKANGVQRKSIGFEMLERGIPRHGYRVVKDGQEIGFVTSGTHSPTLNKPIGIAYVKAEYAGIGTNIAIDLRGRLAPAVVVKTPFVPARTT